MKTDILRSTPLKRLVRSIEHASVVMLTSLDADGALLTRPMTPVEVDGDGGLWFFTDLYTATAGHQRLGNVSFTDAARGTYVSLRGHNEIHNDRERIERLWRSFAGPASEGPEHSNLALLRFVPDAIDDWDAPSGAEVELFAKAASLGTRKSVRSREQAFTTGLSA